MTAPAPDDVPDRVGSDWPAQITDTIVGYVDTAREKTTGPAVTVARGVVYGTFAAIVGLAALTLTLVALFRGLDLLIQVALDAAGLEKPGRSTWIAHLLVGLLFTAVGLVVWRKGTATTSEMATTEI